ncbi:ATP-binding protein [Neptuniibacter sp. SY11_33]|uniref:ATP-binding protein n=1 Tax=Neptuniibacter sp. SY11_33 TaxID=3398215 RepID=UPI0039F60406
MSFRLKTILGIAVIESILLTFIILISLDFLRKASLDDLIQYCRTNSELFVTATKNAVISQDLATLHSTTDDLLDNSDVLYVRIYGRNKLLIDKGKKNYLEYNFVEENGKELPEDGVFDIQLPIMESGYYLGKVEIGYNAKKSEIRLHEASVSIGSVALIELILCALFSLILGTYLTRQMTLLQVGSKQLAKGNWGHQIEVSGNDEIAQASLAFNYMSTQIKKLIESEKKQRKYIAQREFLFKSLLQGIPSGVLLSDSNGKVLFSNLACFGLLDLLHLPDRSILADSIDELIDYLSKVGVNENSVKDFFSLSLINNKPISNFEIPLKKGRTLEVDYRPIKFGVDDQKCHLWYLRDISDRKSKELIIRQRSKELTAIFDLSPDGLVSFDYNGVIQMVNDTFLKILNCKLEEVVGKDMQLIDDLLRKRIVSGTSILEVDYLNKKYIPPQFITIKLNGISHLERIIRFEEGEEFLGGIVYFRDVTEQKKLEIMKSDFLSTAAHELRTPLASVYGYSELLLNASFDKSTTYDMLTIVHNQVGRLVNILNDLLDLARIEAKGANELIVKECDLKRIVNDAVGLQQSKGNRVSLSWNLNDITIIRCDKDKIIQVLNNIISNAMKYSPADSPIEIEISESSRLDTLGVDLKIKDYGIGMNRQELEMIFERFYRADQSGAIPGTGLGMSIVKEIVDMHYGEITIDSHKNVGTLVSVWLPIRKI